MSNQFRQCQVCSNHNTYQAVVQLQDLPFPNLGNTQAWVVMNCDNSNLLGSQFKLVEEEGKNFNIGNRAYWLTWN